MPLADSGESLVLNTLLTGRFLSLHINTPPTGEVVGGSYARQAVTFVKRSGPDPTVYKNSVLVQFPSATAGWGVITHFGVWSAASGGNLLAYNVVTTPKAVDVGDVVQWEVDSLVVDTN